MSTSSPGQPDNSAGSAGETPSQGASGATSGGGKPSGKFWAIAAVIALLVGVGGFFLGQSLTNAKYDPGKKDYNKIFAAGAAAGIRSGTATGLAQGKRIGTQNGLQIGTAAGKQQGLKQGEAAGKAAGYKDGFSAGVSAGSTAALGGLTGWNTNVPYVVELDPSPVNGVPYQIYSRTLMKAGISYTLCPNGRTACQAPVPPTPPTS